MLSQIEPLIINSVVVFALTLTITKSRLFACKRKFVDERYQLAKDNGDASFLHKVWHAIWNCPMCSGFYFAAIIAIIFPVDNVITDTLFLYGMNWILHCLEDRLYWTGKAYSDSPKE